ncbi:MAG: alpha/beta hydrolase-fold protein [Spirochaetia bacterium]|nr:alpha/beta hydrolase-fold protein [Spirochaetota bacterium]MCX8096964.1 alpha/beta hydrolase-fold protein [Spirochaetota bacterium]MDW8112395.1 alpha/beta hydrolase-fold protein [Spirochaetia bacterium]
MKTKLTILFLVVWMNHIFANVDEFIRNLSNIQDRIGANTLVSNFLSNISLPIVKGDDITFLYFQSRGKSPEGVEIILFLDGKFSTNTMSRVGASDLFMFKTNFGSIKSFEYVFRVIFSETSRRIFNDPYNRVISFRRDLVMNKVSKDTNDSMIITYDIEPKTQISKLEKRKLWIYLPPNYHSSKQSYPVLYMQDGQNVWDGNSLPFGGWKVNTIIEKLVNEGKIEPVIVVGIANSGERPKEYVGFSTLYGMQVSETQKQLVIENQNKSLAYMDFVVNEVMPFVETNFRVKKGRDNTAVAGSSFGAGVSLYIAFNHPDKFGLVGSLSGGHYPTNSPQFQQKPYKVFDYLIEQKLPQKPNLKIFLSCGTTDIDAMFVKETEKMHNALVSRGWKEKENLYYLISTNKGHNEATWAEQLPEMLTFFFGKKR